MKKIKFASIYLLTLAIIFMFLGAYMTWHDMHQTTSFESIADKPSDLLEFLHLIFFFLGFSALSSIYYAEKIEVKALSLTNAVMQKEICERKKTEKSLAESEEKFRNLFENAPDGITLIDSKGSIVLCNTAEQDILGFNHEEIVGKQIDTFLSDKSKPILNQKLSILMKMGISEVETEIVHKDGTVIPTWKKVTALYDNEGAYAGAIVHTRDVTHKKQAEKERLQCEKLQGVIEMAGAVCHELNQPLQCISGYSDLLMMEINENDSKYKKIESIKQQVDRMGEINRKFMGVTRYETREYLEGKIIDIDKA